MSLIQIKRSINTSFPPGLANGELAFTSNGNVLYIGAPGGTANDVLAIAGERNPGTLTANQALVANSTSGIDHVISNNIETVGALTANGGVGTAGQVLTSNGSVAYWSTIASGGLGNVVEDTTPQLGGDLDTNGFGISLKQGTVDAANGALYFGVDTDTGIYSPVADSISLFAGGIEGARVYETTGAMTLQVNGSIEQITAGARFYGGDGAVGTPGITFWNDSNTGVYRPGADILALTAGGVEGFRLTEVGGNVSLAANGDLAVTGDITAVDMTLSGNLVINGTLTTIDTTNLTVDDPLISLARNNNATDTVDIGFFGLYDTSGSLDLYGGLFRDATDGKFKFFVDSQSAPTTTVDTGATGYTVATIVAHLEDDSVSITGGSITGITDLAVADGGTGVSTFTTNGVLYGQGASALAVTAAGADGEVLQSVSGVPTFGSIDGGTF